MRRRAGAVFLGVVLVAVTHPPAPVLAEEAVRVEPIRLKVATFNIEYGGHLVSFDAVVRAIRRSGADVVGIEEAWGNVPALARALGWPYHSARLAVVSRYPLIDPPPGGEGWRYLFVEVVPGRVVAVQNVHLWSNPYSPFKILRRDWPRERVLRVERRVRLHGITGIRTGGILASGERLLERGVPTFLVGDFNAPSWRDWTPRMVGARPQIRYPVRWPVSLAVERAGFVDSYRAAHPDPARKPGLTWWADRPDVPGWDPPRSAPQDRIDFVYAGGVEEVVGSKIVGEAGSPYTDIAVRPWPSDHRMVVSTFLVRPVEPPPLVAPERQLVPVGRQIRVRFHAPALPGVEVTVRPAGADPLSPPLAEASTDGVADGMVAFDTTGWSPGAYAIALVSGGGKELAHTRAWVMPVGAEPELRAERTTYRVGEPIRARWRFVRPARFDWIGVFPADGGPYDYLWFGYTRARPAGSLTVDDRGWGSFPLRPGRYRLGLLRDDRYRVLAWSEPFRVVRD